MIKNNLKKGVFIFCLALLMVVPFVSAGFFSDFWDNVQNKISGKVISSDFVPIEDGLDDLNEEERIEETNLSVSGGDVEPTGSLTGWTQWFDMDDVSGSGDYELISSLKEQYPGKICETILDVECQTVDGMDYSETGETVVCSKESGFMCMGSQQPSGNCLYDYKVRFYCGGDTISSPEEENLCTTPDSDAITSDSVYYSCKDNASFEFEDLSGNVELFNEKLIFNFDNGERLDVKEDPVGVSFEVYETNSGKRYLIAVEEFNINESFFYITRLDDSGASTVMEYSGGEVLFVPFLTFDETGSFSFLERGSGVQFIIGNFSSGILAEADEWEYYDDSGRLIVFEIEVIVPGVGAFVQQEEDDDLFTPYSGTCSDLVYFMDNYEESVNNLDYEYARFFGNSSTDEPVESFNRSEWINGKDERYVKKFFLFEGSDISYWMHINIFENKNIDLNKYFLDVYGGACQPINISSLGQQVWKCDNVRALLGGDEVYESRVVWYNENVLVQILVNQFDSVSELQFIYSEMEKGLGNFESLKDNKYTRAKSYLPSKANFVLEYLLSICPSEVFVDESEIPRWSCALEPVICPPHGKQIERCVDLNGNFGEIERSIECNPGICSGCMVTKYFAKNSAMQERRQCMPYGARFEFVDSELNSLFEIDDVYSNGDVEILNVLDDSKAYIKIVQNNKTIIDGTFRQGDSIKLVLDGNEIIMEIKDIYYSSKESGKNYVSVKLSENINAYCDYDGEVKSQKSQTSNGWAECQNNFECKSNICSGGECVEVQSMFEEVNGIKKLFVTVLCKISNFLGSEKTYEECISGKI